MTQPLLSNITITNTHARRGLDLGNRSAPPGGRMTRTTPARPVDVAAVFPQLAPLARTATRLHPRPGSPSPHDSSADGPLLWPAAEPWPYCDGPHVPDGVNPAISPGDVRLKRRIRAAAASRPRSNPWFRRFTPEELAISDRIKAGRPWPEDPVAMLPVVQLYVRDIPCCARPGSTPTPWS
jgi:hypothetical protein